MFLSLLPRRVKLTVIHDRASESRSFEIIRLGEGYVLGDLRWRSRKEKPKRCISEEDVNNPLMDRDEERVYKGTRTGLIYIRINQAER